MPLWCRTCVVLEVLKPCCLFGIPKTKSSRVAWEKGSRFHAADRVNRHRKVCSLTIVRSSLEAAAQRPGSSLPFSKAQIMGFRTRIWSINLNFEVRISKSIFRRTSNCEVPFQDTTSNLVGWPNFKFLWVSFFSFDESHSIRRLSGSSLTVDRAVNISQCRRCVSLTRSGGGGGGVSVSMRRCTIGLTMFLWWN